MITSTSRCALVTGGAGFIGSHVVDALIDKGWKCVVVDDLSGGFRENVNPRAEFHAGSVTDPAFIDSLFTTYKVDYIYHLAAYAAEGLSHFIRRFNYTNNVLGSMNLINAAIRHNAKCFVFTSSIAVYGKGQIPMHEDLSPAPEDPYGIAKLSVELDLRAAHRMFGLNYIVFRPHNVYGERQNIGDPYRNVVGIFMNQIMQGQPCGIFGDGSQTRAFSYIGDVAPVIAHSVEVPEAYGEVFNVGADTPYAVSDLAKLVQAAMGRETGVRHLPAREEVVHAFSAHDKCERVFGYRARVTLPEGLRRMAEWAQAAGFRKGRPFEGIEITAHLPESWRALCTMDAQSAS